MEQRCCAQNYQPNYARRISLGAEILRAARRTGSRRAQTYLSYVKVVCVEQRRCAQNYQPNYARRISLGAEILRAARRTGSRRAQTYLSY
ncbi:MAG: hypothetical protein IJC99_03640, partial [Clostridia bacterium]|nr:hypothetical protein [Clostridia bacterium]